MSTLRGAWGFGRTGLLYYCIGMSRRQMKNTDDRSKQTQPAAKWGGPFRRQMRESLSERAWELGSRVPSGMARRLLDQVRENPASFAGLVSASELPRGSRGGWVRASARAKRVA